MVKECLVLAHSDSERASKTLVNCVSSLKEKGYRVVVSDHFFNKDAYQIADAFVYNYDNPILKPSEYKKYNLNHTTHKDIDGYRLYSPVSSFAAYAIIELIKSGFDAITSKKCLVLNYDWHMKEDIDEYYNINKDGVFFKYADDKSFYTSIFVMNKELLRDLYQINSIDDYANNLKYLEWFFYDLYSKKNISIIDQVPSDRFDDNLYYRVSEINIDKKFYKVSDGKVIYVDGDKIQEYTEHKQYRLIEGDKTYIANLGEDYFTYHIAVKL